MATGYIICDIDGTLTDLAAEPNRALYKEKKEDYRWWEKHLDTEYAFTDRIFYPVIEEVRGHIINAILAKDDRPHICFITSRPDTDTCRRKTTEWLLLNIIPELPDRYFGTITWDLIMREENDYAAASLVKYELLKEVMGGMAKEDYIVDIYDDDREVLASYKQLLTSSSNTGTTLLWLVDTLAKPYTIEQFNLTNSPSVVAKRDNKGKTQLSYIADFPNALEGAANVLSKVCDDGRYERYNWKMGMSYNLVIDSLLRHLVAYKNGTDIDEKEGLPTVDFITTNALLLAEYSRTHPELDDRHKKE